MAASTSNGSPSSADGGRPVVPPSSGPDSANGGGLLLPSPDALESVARFLIDTQAGIIATADKNDGYKVVNARWKERAKPVAWADVPAVTGYLAETFKRHNLAVVVAPDHPHTGKLVFVDLDGEKAKERFKTFGAPRTFSVRSGRGWHLWYFAPPECEQPKVEFRDDGTIQLSGNGYGLLAGSWHAEAKRFYEVIADRPVVQLPADVYTAMRQAAGRMKQAAKQRVESGEKIPKGQRDTTLTAYAGYMHSVGFPESTTLAAVQDLAENHCEPPADREYIETLLPDKVARWYRQWDGPGALDPFALPDFSAPAPASVQRRPGLKEDELADHFVRSHGPSFRYFLEGKRWIYFEQGRWHEPGGTHVARQACVQLLREIKPTYADALPDGDPYKEAVEKFHKIRAIRNARDNILNIAESQLLVTASRLNRDPMLLAVGNGLLDLQTLEFRDGKPDDLITVGSSVDYVPDRRSALWEDRFLPEVFPDPDLRAYMQRFAGLCLTGLTHEELLWVFWGPGRNGKGTFLGALAAVLGDELAAAINFATLATDKYRSGSSASSDVARLRGKRLVVASEKNPERVLDEERIKKLTGGDPITASFKYENEMQFSPSFKLVLAVNEKPKINAADDAIRARVVLVPFTQQFLREDGTLDMTIKERLTKEPEQLEGILSWMLAGLRQYNTHGLGSCQAIEEATDEYLREMNPLADFVAQTFAVTDGNQVPTPGHEMAQLYADYLHETAALRLTDAEFGNALRALGFSRKHTKQGSVWIGPRPKGLVQ